MYAPPPHNKTPPVQVSMISEQSSQIQEKRTKKLNPRESLATSELRHKGRAANRIRQAANREELRVTVVNPGAVSCSLTL